MTSYSRSAARIWLALSLLAFAASPAIAAVPTTSSVEGVLTSAGGGAAADGSYDLTFAVYDGKAASSAAWQEGPVKVTVAGGRFAYQLGATKPLDSQALAALKAPWFGVKVGADPELPRQPLNSVAYAQVSSALSCTGCVTGAQLATGAISAAKVGFNYAGAATKGGAALDLACTGCVSVAELKFDANVDLGSFSLKAKNGTFTGDVAASTITATAFVGDGSKLSGIKIPTGECKVAGEVVKGINPDGSLKCVKSVDPSALPKDGLNEISNNLLSNQFVDTISASTPNVAIPDNQGTEAVSNLTFPNLGDAQDFELSVHVESTDLSTLAITVLPPDDKKVGWTLCDPCGVKDAKVLKATYGVKAKPKTGDIGAWIDKNPQGLWNLKVKDTSFCILQAPGNAKYCDPIKKTDGWIATWSIKIQTLSNQKVQANGDLYVTGKLKGNAVGNGAGQVPTNNAAVSKGLFAELAGNNWKQCSWHNLNSGLDEGVVVKCPYVKNYDSTALRLVWNGTLRSSYGVNGQCKEWYFTIDGQECSKPAAVEGVKYSYVAGGSWVDLHQVHTIEGICSQAGGAINKGTRNIEFRIRNCAGYSANDGYTGWNSTSRIIIQELPMGQ